jgi:hypothetical protein
MSRNDLAATEREAFRSVVDTGLWDILLASVVSMLAIGPLLSRHLGDFWSAAVFLPVWLGLFLLLRTVQERWVVPRVGVVRFGEERKARMKRFSLVLLVFNLIAFALGVVAALRAGQSELWIFPLGFSLTVLVFASLAALAMQIPRIFAYGLLLAIGAPIGEWLFRHGYASHHGFPVVFGGIAILIALIGLAKLWRVLRTHPPIPSEPASASSHD